MCLLEAKEAIENAEKRLGFEIDPLVALKVYRYSVRKLEVIGKGSDYLPILYESELYDHYMRMAITVGGLANV